MSAEYADVSWYPITELDLDDVAGYQLLGVHVQLVTVTYHDRELKSTPRQRSSEIDSSTTQ